jgi:chitinase
MRVWMLVPLLLATLATAGSAGAANGAANKDGKVVVGYFASWDVYGRGYFPKQIPADGVTHLNYAFGTPTADGGCTVADPWADYQMVYWSGDNSVDGQADVDATGNFFPDQHLFGNFNQLRKLKAAHPDLKILIALGGWTLSTYFSDVAATPESRTKFVKACIDTFIRGNLPTGGWPEQAGGTGAAAGLFDGIDIDWEYPGTDPGNGAHYTAADRHNATLLLREFRRQLDAIGSENQTHYLLTAALPAGNVHSDASWELADVARVCDWINLMTYDFHGPWDAQTNFNSPFLMDPADPTPPAQRPVWNVVGTVAYYLAHGVPRSRLTIGVPFYARQYIRVGSANRGLYQPFDNTGLSENTLQWDETPVPTYHDLIDVAGVVTPGGQGQNGFTRYWSFRTGEPWLYDPAATRFGQTAGVFISYEDPRSVAERTFAIQALGLRGAMFWEISQDSDDHALVNALSPLLR